MPSTVSLSRLRKRRPELRAADGLLLRRIDACNGDEVGCQSARAGTLDGARSNQRKEKAMRKFPAAATVIAAACISCNAAAGSGGPLGIDHRLNFDDSGIWSRSN